MNIRSSSDARTAPRLHSSDDGLFLATSTLRRLEENVQHWRFSAHSMSEPRIDVQFPVSEHSEGATERYKGLRRAPFKPTTSAMGQTRTSSLGPHVRFRRVQTLAREGSPLVKLRN